MTASLLAASGLSSRTATAVAREVRLAADTGIAVDRLRDASNRTFEARREVARFLQMLELGNPRVTLRNILIVFVPRLLSELLPFLQL